MSRSGRNALAVTLTLSVGIAMVAAWLVFSGKFPPYQRPPISDSDYAPPQISIAEISFGDLDGWRNDDLTEAIPVFLRSCVRIDALEDSEPVNPVEALGEAFTGRSLSGGASDWRVPCEEARAVAATRYSDANAAAAAARAFFEFHFRPLKVISLKTPKPDGAAKGLGPRASKTGLFTGYFEPTYPASRFRTDEFSAPVYFRPANLVMVDIGEFREALAGERIAGYVEEGRLRPYPDHKSINEGALNEMFDEGEAPLAWLKPNDLFFLQIQGSGRLQLPGGKALRIGYDGQNGRPYTPIGRLLVERGVMSLDVVSMQTIRGWLETAPAEEARALREANQSYVFFRELDDLPDPSLGPIGAEGVQLTPTRSLAVDRRYHAMGAPVWLSIPAVEGRTPEINRLFIAQDTGGAIRGPIRGDIFIGAGERAGAAAGRLRAEGEMIVFVPKPVAARLENGGLLAQR